MIIPAGEIQFNRATVTDALPHTCTILRRAQTGTNPYEEPVYGDYTVASQKPCRFWIVTPAGTGERTDDRRTVLQYEYRLKLEATADITEADIVDDITNQLGEAMHVVQLRVQAVWRQTHQTVVALEKVK
jgi:hypothetical protein